MKYIDVVGKTIQDAISQGLEEFGTTEDNVEITILKQAGMFSKAKVRLTLINADVADKKGCVCASETNPLAELEDNAQKKDVQNDQVNAEVDDVQELAQVPNDEEISNEAGKILAQVCAQISPAITIKATQKERVLVYEINGEGSDKLIGKDGQALEALQLVLNSINRHKQPDVPYIVLRVAEYEKMKEQKLQKIAVDSANKAIEINNSVRLATMNSYERRIVHAFLQQDERVVTESFGVEPYRYITVRPKSKE